MGGSAAPTPDPAVAEAAKMSAQTGRDTLEFFKGQAAVSNAWAKEDRARWDTQFKPMEDKFIADSVNYDSKERRDDAANTAQADVQQGMQSSNAQRQRQSAAMGVKPGSGRSNEGTRRTSTDMGLATAGARNTARRQVESVGYGREATAVNLGKGYASNPGTSMGMANAAGGAGFSGAQAGYGQQANILNQQYNQEMQTWQANEASNNSLMSGLGTIAGYAMMSSEDVKTNKVTAKGSLGAVRGMRVDEWDYKKGVADEGRHVGPYAEEFKEQTGLGDGKTINYIDAIGTALGAIKELDAKVEAMAA
jgi:hypothetical protein